MNTFDRPYLLLPRNAIFHREMRQGRVLRHFFFAPHPQNPVVCMTVFRTDGPPPYAALYTRYRRLSRDIGTGKRKPDYEGLWQHLKTITSATRSISFDEVTREIYDDFLATMDRLENNYGPL